MAAQNSNSANATASLSQRLNKMIAGGSLDYNYWRSLILEIETTSPEDINTLSLAYDSFLSMFPLCHWHLEKYAYQKAKLCSSQEAISIYERGVEVAMFSVGFWVNHFTFAAACFGDPEDVRRLFGRAISFVGKDYFCHVLWDKYLKYEFNQEGWSFLAQSYIQVLRFPTKKLHFYYDNFKQFVANLEEEMGYDKTNSIGEHASVPCTGIDLSKDEISLVIKDMLDSSDRSLKSKALDEYRSTGAKFYQEACQMDAKIKRFETKIQRRYFDVTPLDDDQLNNWHLYLDFIEKEDNLDWAMKLYERCLIPCANYPEFWMRYVEFLESKGGRELAISSIARATQIFLKNVPEIHLFDARFKEHIGDANSARAALVACDTKTDSNFIENIAIQANLERRLGNFAAASATYEKALKKARERQKLHLLPSLFSHFARLTFLMTGSAIAARDVLIEGIREVPHCRFLLEELVKFAMTHEGASHVNIIDSIIADAISPGLDEYEGLNAKDREDISRLFLEFVDLCGTTHDIRKAWNRHVKLFPQSLRIRTPYKHPTPGNYSTDLALDKKGNYDLPVHSQPSRNPSFGHHHQLHQERVLEFPVNNEIHPNRVAGKLSPQKDHSTILTKGVVSSNDDESRGNEMACEISCQSREDGPGPVVVGAELGDQTKENALSVCDSDQDLLHRSGGDEPRPMDVGDELGMQSKENALSPHESALEIGKSTETTEPIEASHSSLIPVRSELDHEPKQQNHPVSTDNVSLKSQQKESERDGSVSRQHNTPKRMHTDPEEPSRTGEDSIDVDHMVPPPTSGSEEHAQDHEHKVEQSSYCDHHPMVMNQSNARQNLDKATDQDQPVSTMTPSNNMSAGQQPVSYSQQNTNQVTSLSGQHPWQAQESMSMNQMLQYHYHQQQQLLQQQYQQQLQMQNSYFQLQQHYMNQQPYQYEQQHYVQQQQHQSSTYQPINSFEPSQQRSQPQHHQQSQPMQGQEPRLNFQQAQTQYHQSPDPAYQAYQLAYQQYGSQEQQLLWQQYQQYQGYQHPQHQHPSQKQQDELVQQHHQQVHSKQNLTQSMSQNQKGSRTATSDYDGAAKPSESPHLRVQSPQVLQ